MDTATTSRSTGGHWVSPSTSASITRYVICSRSTGICLISLSATIRRTQPGYPEREYPESSAEIFRDKPGRVSPMSPSNGGFDGERSKQTDRGHQLRQFCSPPVLRRT